MVENTHILSLRSEDLIPTVENILTNPNVPYIEQNAFMGIMNNYGSDSVMKIKEIQINEIIGRTTTALTAIDLWRISAVVSGETITPIKYDSSSANLPSQVSIVKYPNSVTTSGSYLRRLISLTGLSATAALMRHTGLRGPGGLRSSGMNLNHVISSFDANTQVQTLREGQGIAIKSNLTAPMNYAVELLVHFSDGTNTYCVSEIINIQSATELFALLNGSGSGVVLYVSRLEMRLIRTSDIIRDFNIETCSKIYNGTTLTPLSMDSNNPAIPATVQFRQNCVVRQANIDAIDGRNARAGGDMVSFRRMVQPSFGVGVALANGALTLRPRSNKTFGIDKINNIGEIVLREGEGLCLLQKVNYAIWGNYEFIITFTIETSSIPAGGEHSYVF
jgi:hypothetical protein